MVEEIFGIASATTTNLEIAFYIFLIAFIGALIGGITGLGGGMIIKPMFGSILKMTTEIGLLVSKFISTGVVLSMSARSVNYYYKQNFKFDLRLGIFVGLGIFFGIVLVGLLPTISYQWEVLLQGILYFIVFFVVLLRDYYPSYNYQNNILVIIVVGIAIGFLSGFFGIGGGAIKIPFFLIFFAMTMKQAAIYSFFASLVSEPLKLLQYGNHIMELDPTNEAMQIAIMGALVAAVAAIIGGTIGVKIQHRSSDKTVANAFSAVIIYFAVQSLLSGVLMITGVIDQPLSIFDFLLQ